MTKLLRIAPIGSQAVEHITACPEHITARVNKFELFTKPETLILFLNTLDYTVMDLLSELGQRNIFARNSRFCPLTVPVDFELC